MERRAGMEHPAGQGAACQGRGAPTVKPPIHTPGPQVLRRTGTPKESRRAARVLPVIVHTHWVLCTLVLCNALCASALPVRGRAMQQGAGQPDSAALLQALAATPP